MHAISSQDQSWINVFEWRGEPTFHKHLKRSFPSAVWIWGDHVFSVSSGMDRERPWLKEGPISLHWLKFRLVFNVTRRMHVWVPCGDPRERRRCPPHLNRGPQIPLPLGGTRNKMLHNVTIPDSSWNWIGIPISLCQLESETWSPASPPEASVLFWQT